MTLGSGLSDSGDVYRLNDTETVGIVPAENGLYEAEARASVNVGYLRDALEEFDSDDSVLLELSEGSDGGMDVGLRPDDDSDLVVVCCGRFPDDVSLGALATGKSGDDAESDPSPDGEDVSPSDTGESSERPLWDSEKNVLAAVVNHPKEWVHADEVNAETEYAASPALSNLHARGLVKRKTKTGTDGSWWYVYQPASEAVKREFAEHPDVDLDDGLETTGVAD